MEGESFSDLVIRLTERRDISEFAWKDFDEAEKMILEGRYVSHRPSQGEGICVKKYEEIKNLTTTSIVAWEILRGPRLVDRVKEYQIAMRLLDRLEILPFTLTSAKVAADIEQKLRRKGKAVSLVEILIAAVAIENQSKLVTRDRGYENIDDLEVEFY